MRRMILAAMIALIVAEPALGGSFGIDFSPLREPGFGKRRDYGVDRPVERNSSAPAQPRQPSGPSDAMKKVGRELDAGQAQLTRDIIKLPDDSTLVDASYNRRTVEMDIGDALFNLREGDVSSFTMIPDDYHPPVRVARDALPIAAQLLGYAASFEGQCLDAMEGFNCEDASFLAGQAALAMEGRSSLKVTVDPLLPEVTGRERADADRATATLAQALTNFRTARADRRRAEASVLTNPISVSSYEGAEREREKELIYQRYLEAVRAERLLGEELFGARRELRAVMKRIAAGSN